MNSEDFYAKVKKKIESHPFEPKCIEATMRKENARKASQRYEKTFKAKIKHRKWDKTDAGKRSNKVRCDRYREKNKENEEFILRKRRNSVNSFRRRREKALFLVLTNIDQEALDT
ncbi:hypothetical protein SAMN05720766_10980 [Fibrobacter sp. UWH9]|nr:hypothetical protein SAMN05720766_10980 [Fibrobacter sp. UWH9]